MATDWEHALSGLGVATAAHAGRLDLQRRAESKFVMPAGAALALLPGLRLDYAVLPAGQVVLAAYRTLYFDTADLAFFHAHRRGRRVRHKVRIRHYPDRCLSFLEVKTRRGEDLTTKARRAREYGDSLLGSDDLAFVRARAAVERDLLPQAWIDFRRVTLLGTERDERVTIDLDLRVTTASRVSSLADVAVVEVKQPRLDRGSVAMQTLRRAGWRPGGNSKYCWGIALTRPEVPTHRLWPDLRTLQGIAACPS
jgi:hypothetical protein